MSTTMGTTTGVTAAQLRDFNSSVSTFVKTIDDAEKYLKGVEAMVNRIEANGGGAAAEVSEERKAFRKYLRFGKEGISDIEHKSLRVSDNPAGGYLADTEMVDEWIREVVEYSPIRALSSVRTTSQSSVRWPKRIGRTNAKWRGENVTSEKSGPTFGELEIFPKELTTHVELSNRLLMDAVVNPEDEVRLALAEDFGLKEGEAHLYGDGTTAPKGLLVGDELDYFPNGHASTISADKLIEFLYTLPAYYRSKSTWVMNGTTLAKVRQLKDGVTGSYLWQPAYMAGQPETLLGRPVVEHPDMPDATSGKFPILLGDFNAGFQIIDRQELAVLVDPYAKAKEGITTLHATRFTGSGVRQKAALRKFKMSNS